MNEPRLEDIGDYKTLKGTKKKVVWSVIAIGILIGAIYVVVDSVYGTAEDSIETTDSIKNIPLK